MIGDPLRRVPQPSQRDLADELGSLRDALDDAAAEVKRHVGYGGPDTPAALAGRLLHRAHDDLQAAVMALMVGAQIDSEIARDREAL